MMCIILLQNNGMGVYKERILLGLLDYIAHYVIGFSLFQDIAMKKLKII